MKNTILFLIVSAGTVLIAGCSTQSVYVQNISVHGPLAQAPLFTNGGNKQGDFRIAPRLSIADKTPLVGRASGHTNVDKNGVYQVDTVHNANGSVTYTEKDGVNTETFAGRNFRWEPVKYNASLGFEYLATDHIALVAGGTYSSNSSQNYLSANAGVGFLFEGRHIAARIDLGAHWNAVSYDVDYAVATTTFTLGPQKRYVAFVHESGKDSYMNAYGAFTLNTKVSGWPVQFFAQAAFNRQTIIDIDRQVVTIERTDAVVLESVSYFMLTPGVYFDIAPDARVLLGVQLRDETALLEEQPGVLVSPFIQFEFGL